MNKLKLFAVGASGLTLVLASSAPAGAAAADGQSGAVSTAAAVASFYDTYHSQPIWFRNGANTAAIAHLTAILQRAPFGGSQVRASVLRIVSVGEPAVVAYFPGWGEKKILARLPAAR